MALTATEMEWVVAQLETAIVLARAYMGDSENPPSLARLDATWIAWQTDSSQARPDPNTVVNGLGIAFGKHLATALELDWAIVTDEYGTDLAVVGQPNSVTLFPADMISKRLDERGPIFSQLHRDAVERVKDFRSKHKAAPN